MARTCTTTNSWLRGPADGYAPLLGGSKATISSWMSPLQRFAALSFGMYSSTSQSFLCAWDEGYGLTINIGNGSSASAFVSLAIGTAPRVVTAVYDGTQADNASRLKLWIGGVQQTLTFTGTVASTLTSSTSARWATGYNFGERGTVAEQAAWSEPLTSQDCEALGAGYSPAMVRPEALAGYWPMLGLAADERDLVGDQNLIATGTVTTVDHPRVIYPPARRVYRIAAASPYPTLSAATVTNITATTARPRVTITFP